MVQMKMMMLFIVVVVSCVMMKIVFCSALSHEVLNSQHYKHSQSTEACADDAKKWVWQAVLTFISSQDMYF